MIGDKRRLMAIACEGALEYGCFPDNRKFKRREAKDRFGSMPARRISN